MHRAKMAAPFVAALLCAALLVSGGTTKMHATKMVGPSWPEAFTRDIPGLLYGVNDDGVYLVQLSIDVTQGSGDSSVLVGVSAGDRAEGELTMSLPLKSASATLTLSGSFIVTAARGELIVARMTKTINTFEPAGPTSAVFNGRMSVILVD